MFRRPVGHKREGLDRDLTFRRPNCACFACYDTGVITNGDGLLNELLPDYDRNLDGRRIAGQDLPLICHCPAAYAPPGQGGTPQSGEPQGPRPQSGLRGGDGLVARGLASELTREQVSELHERRVESWRQTERQMRDARMARAAGDHDAVPWFIAEVRHAVAAQQARYGNGGGDGDQPSPTARRLQPLGGVIAETLASADPEAAVQRSTAPLEVVPAAEAVHPGPPPDAAA
ncbi:hypothetical protein KBY96_14185 [Cyanobium sp. ATX 6A2]|uniref:hypothetical protein n=1 Tax=Cyanobium sp. ATX 6A2 TaxID=2823700 RepID=UPI0020CD4592|nr:hypothetical protein [Cyanobium sp. ATX 6A2]MCP9889072.1 hypothetical protein [Cyanobium sp. ATX 6A2]